MLPHGGSHFVYITQSATFHVLNINFRNFHKLFYNICRCLDGCNTMPSNREGAKR